MTHLDIDLALLVAVPPERMTVLLASDIDALPTKLLNGNKCLVNMPVLGNQIGPEVESKSLRVKDVWGCLGEI